MIFSPLLKKGILLLAFCGVLGGGVLSAQETGGSPITEEGLKALDSNVFANEYMLALKPNVTRDRIAKIKDPFVRGLAEQMAEKKFDRKARALTAEPYEPVKDLAERLRTSQYSKFENPTGIFFEEGEDVLLVMGDPKGEKLNLVIHNFGRDGGHSSYPLKEGVNIIRAKNKGLGYIEYFTSNYKKAPKVHLSILSGKVNGVFVGGVSKKLWTSWATACIWCIRWRNLNNSARTKGRSSLPCTTGLSAWSSRSWACTSTGCCPKTGCSAV